MAKVILNIAAGKLDPIFDNDIKDEYVYLINLDPMYFDAANAQLTENHYIHWDESKSVKCYCNESAETFMERTKIIFDHVCIYRFLEHISFTEVEYFIYLLSTITKKDSIIDIIVPNYEILAELIIKDDPEDPDFAADNILLTTELLNEPSCPHASIWTIPRIYHFFELEGYFKVIDVEDEYEFDGRDIYVRFKVKRK